MSKRDITFYSESPPDPVECPERCPYCPESRSYKDCREPFCISDSKISWWEFRGEEVCDE